MLFQGIPLYKSLRCTVPYHIVSSPPLPRPRPMGLKQIRTLVSCAAANVKLKTKATRKINKILLWDFSQLIIDLVTGVF